MDPEKIMPLILLWILWLIAVANVRGHFKNRKMRAYLRKGVDDDNLPDAPAHHSTTPSEHPASYWALLLLYSLSAIFVPVVTLYILL